MMMRSLFKSLLLAGFSLVAVNGVFAQDKQPVDTAASASAQSEADVQEKSADTGVVQYAPPSARGRVLYFIGPKANLERQTGPGIGAPKSILPTPFVPRGSLAVPVVEAVIVADNSTSQGEKTLDDPENEDLLATEVQPLDGETAAPQEGSSEEDAVQEQPSDTLSSELGVFQEGMLERIDPSGVPVRGNIDGLETVWEGYSRGEVVNFLSLLAQPSNSPTLTGLANAVAASRMALPKPSDDDEVVRMIEARLAVFAAFANVDAYTALIDVLPVDRDWSALAKHFARAHMLKGALPAACDVAEAQRTQDKDPYWVQLAAFCMATNGNRVGVDFQLSILEETTTLNPVFYQLLDQILVEAEQPAGAPMTQPIALASALKTDVLFAVMARLARVTVSDVEIDTLNPLALPVLMQNPSVSREAQAKLMTFLMSRGAADGAVLSRFALNMPLSDDDITNSFAELDAKELVAGENLDLEGDAETLTNTDLPTALPEGMLDTILLAATGQSKDTALSAAALSRLWDKKHSEGNIEVIASGIFALTKTWPKDRLAIGIPEIASRAAALTSVSSFLEYVRTLRVAAAGQDSDKDSALIGLWPLLFLAETNAPVEVNIQHLEHWWQNRESSDDRFKVANMLLTIFEGFGHQVPESFWQQVAPGPAIYEGVSVSPSLWRALLQGAEARDPIAVLSATHLLLKQVRPKDLPPSVVGTLIASLHSVGFEEAAKSLAFEALISQGL